MYQDDIQNLKKIINELNYKININKALKIPAPVFLFRFKSF